MLGTVTIAGRTFTLGEDFRWSSPDDPGFAAALDVSYDDFPRGPSRGAPGHALLNAVAARFGGAAEPAPKRPDPPGAIY
jgi:hypothetical protein